MRLALPVKHPKHANQVLLKMNYALTPGAIKRMVDLGIRQVWVRYPSLDFIDKYISTDLLEAQEQMAAKAREVFERLQSQANARVHYNDYCNAVGNMVGSLTAHPNAGLFMGDMSVLPQGDELSRNGFATTYLSLLMGLKLETYLCKQRKHCDPARAKDLTNLGLGAMLHDVGMTQIDEQARDGFFDRGDDTDPQYRNHTRLGYELVKGQIEPTAATVLLHHHQQWDGNGFAGDDAPTLAGERIHIFSRIVAVADYFDRFQNSGRHGPRPTIEVLAHMLEPHVQCRFDPIVLRALMEAVPPFAPGSLVQLSDDRWAVVAEHSPDMPCRPLVKLIEGSAQTLDAQELELGEDLDLSLTDTSLYVANAQGLDVSPYNFVSGDLGAINLAAV